jgi:hypothetical protein
VSEVIGYSLSSGTDFTPDMFIFKPKPSGGAAARMAAA